MDEFNFNDLFSRSRDVLGAFRVLYKDLTGEELDVESGIRHYPVVALGAAAAAGVAVGWFAARRTQHQLPPPAAEPEVEPPSATRGPFDALEGFLPGTIESLRSIVPETIAEETTAAARNWIDQRLEPRLRERFEALDTRAGGLLRDALRRFEGGEDTRPDDPGSS
jgi:hypothetical protein